MKSERELCIKSNGSTYTQEEQWDNTQVAIEAISHGQSLPVFEIFGRIEKLFNTFSQGLVIPSSQRREASERITALNRIVYDQFGFFGSQTVSRAYGRARARDMLEKTQN